MKTVIGILREISPLAMIVLFRLLWEEGNTIVLFGCSILAIIGGIIWSIKRFERLTDDDHNIVFIIASMMLVIYSTCIVPLTVFMV